MERQSSNSRPVSCLLTYEAQGRGVQYNTVGCAAVADQARIECDIASDRRALSGRTCRLLALPRPREISGSNTVLPRFVFVRTFGRIR
jgi:hypothetical protein